MLLVRKLLHCRLPTEPCSSGYLPEVNRKWVSAIVSAGSGSELRRLLAPEEAWQCELSLTWSLECTPTKRERGKRCCSCHLNVARRRATPELVHCSLFLVDY